MFFLVTPTAASTSLIFMGHAPLLTGVFYTFHKGEGQAFLQKEPPHKIVQQLLPLKIALDLEPIGTVLLFLHHDMLMVEIEMHRGAQVGVAGQAQQLLYPLLFLRHIEQIAHALLLCAACAADAVGVMFIVAGDIVIDDSIHI